MINPYYSDFDVSGFIVYNVPGVSTSDSVNTIDAGEVAQTELFLDGGATGFTDAANGDNQNITVTEGYGGLTGLANRSFRGVLDIIERCQTRCFATHPRTALQNAVHSSDSASIVT